MFPSNGSGRNPVLEVRRELYANYGGGAYTYKIGEVVESLSTGYAKHAEADEPVLGVIMGFENPNGGLIRPAQPALGSANVGSIEEVTITNGDVIIAVINASQDARWLTAVNGTLGSTNDSDLPACRINVDSANTNYERVLESTADRSGGDENFYSHGVDLDDATKLIVSIYNSELLW